MIARAAAATLLLLLSAGATTARAQTVRGLVVDAAANPVPGVVVLLVDTTARGSVAARALTNDRGEFRLAAGVVGSYRIRTMRIGYRPVSSEPVALHAGETLERRIVLSSVRLVLDTVHVVDRSACRTTGDSGLATFAIWEQVRTALTATLLTSSAGGIEATTIRYARTLDARMRRVRDQQARISSDYVRQPWRALTADSIRRFGYAIPSPGDSTTFYAPGIETLASTTFIADHCFHLQASTDPRTIGVAFTPAPSRRNVPEIAGTLWVDRASAELRSMEYHYVNLANMPADAVERSGGDMEFARMRGGGWVISAWDIRMPLLIEEVNLGHREAQLRALRVSGGLLALARNGRDTIWSRPPRALHGLVVDSTTGRGVPGARVTLRGLAVAAVSDSAGRFTLPDLLYGEYTAEVRTPSLDSLGAVVVSDVPFTDSTSTATLDVSPSAAAAPVLCGDHALFEHDPPVGVLFGRVLQEGDTILPRTATVAVQWKEFGIEEHGNVTSTSMRLRSLGATTDARGEFRVCGVPVNTRLEVAVMVDNTPTPTDTVRIPPGQRFARIDLTADARPRSLSSFHGTVLADSTQLPIAGAEVALPELDRLTFADSTGAFRLADIAPGTHRVRVRRFGYGPLDTTLTFPPRQTLDRQIHLIRVQTLDSMVVTANGVILPGFDDHRRVGLGQFLTRDYLDKHQGTRVSSLLENMRGVKINPGVGSVAWVASSRGPKALDTLGSAIYHLPDATDRSLGAKIDCYAQVYVDGHMMSGRTRTDPLFDINSLQPAQIEAIEYYAGPSETPSEYSGLNSTCGVVVIWTRRTP
ncbi:MAG: carboxypeptidase regulatory-like domain-containing protein [Gemmatimonadales bacterium]